MPATGFDDSRLAARPPGGNIYFAQDQAVASKITESPLFDDINDQRAQAADTFPLQLGGGDLMFGEGQATTGSGENIVSAAQSSRGHVSEILNFHGSPAPWILIGILLAAGLLHISASSSGKVQL